MRKERCASAAPATVYRISHRLIMGVESSKNLKKKKKKQLEKVVAFKR